MALKVWLPLSGDISTNNGLGAVTTVLSQANVEDPTPTFNNSILSGSALRVGPASLTINATLDAAPSEFSVSFWINEASVPAAGKILFKIGSFTCVKNSDGYAIQGLAAGTLFTLPYANRWYFVTITADGTTVKAYVDGVQSEAGDVTQVGNIVSANLAITLGDTESYVTYDICAVKFYDSVLSHFEVVNESYGLVVNYGFNAGVSLGTGISLPEGVTADMMGFGTMESDLSGNGYDGTYGDVLPTKSTDTPLYSSSMDFSAAGAAVTSPPIDTRELGATFTLSVWAKGTGTIVSFSAGGSLSASDANNWHQIVVLSNGKKFVDGVEDTGRINELIGLSGSNVITIGSSFNGKISDFRIYARHLSTDDIMALYKRKAAVDNTGKVIASEFIADDENISVPGFSKTGVVSAAELANWTGEEESPVDVTTFAIYQASGDINASDVIEF